MIACGGNREAAATTASEATAYSVYGIDSDGDRVLLGTVTGTSFVLTPDTSGDYVTAGEDPITVPAAAIGRTNVAAADDTQESLPRNLGVDQTVGDETAVPEEVRLVYCYGPDAVGTARDDAMLSWLPMAGATAYRVYCDGSPEENPVQAPADCLMVSQPLGHTYTVAALFDDYEGGRSQAATLESHNPYFDSSGVSCTDTSCEDDAVLSVCPALTGDGSCTVSVTSIRLDPEVNAENNVYCQYTLTCGNVYVGLTDQDYEGSCWPSFYHEIGSASCDGTHEGEEPCGGWQPCSGDFYCSITKDLLYTDRPTYLTMVVHSCESCNFNSATFYVKGIKPEWIDVGIETEGGGMSEDSCGNWIDTSGSCTCTTSCDDVAYVPGRDGDQDGDGVPDYADFYSSAGGTDLGLVPVSIGGTNLPEGAVVHLDYDASDPTAVTVTGSGTTEDPYVYTLPESGTQRLWITNSINRNAYAVDQGGDYLAPGDYTVSQATGTCDTSLWVTVGSTSVDLKHLYLEEVGSPSSTENASQSESMSGGNSQNEQAETATQAGDQQALARLEVAVIDNGTSKTGDSKSVGQLPSVVTKSFSEGIAPGMGDAIEQVRKRTTSAIAFYALSDQTKPNLERWPGYTQVVQTCYGVFHIMVRGGEASEGEFGVSLAMDFIPNKDALKGATKITVVQQMLCLKSEVPDYLADFHVDHTGKHVETQAAKGWATGQGAYIERPHRVNTPYMAEERDADDDPEGLAGTGTLPLYWEDSPHAPIGNESRASTKVSKQELVACVVCQEGPPELKGMVLGTVRYGWVFTPSGQRGVPSNFEVIKPVFSAQLPQDVRESIIAWNTSAATAKWPHIQVQGLGQ